MRINEKMKRALSILLCVMMLVQYVPTHAFAATMDNLCEHHPVHTDECGYVEAVEGSHCTHVHDELCGYIEAVAEVKCACTETDDTGATVHTEGCGYVAPVAGADCTHSHDELCGYVEAVEGQPCGYECAECASAARITGVSITVDGVDYNSDNATRDTPCVFPAVPESFEIHITGMNLQNGTYDNQVDIQVTGNVPVMEDYPWIFSDDGTSATIDLCSWIDEFDALTAAAEIMYTNDNQGTWLGTGVYLISGEEAGEEPDPVCICETKCSEDSVNSECAVCSADLSGCVGEETSEPDGIIVTIDTGESVTLRDADSDGYYEISTADQLYAFAAAVNGGDNAINGELTANIVVNEGTMTANTTGARVWIPIGNNSNKYTGTFDGGEHTISGLYVNDSAAYYVGLFGCLGSGGTVQNVRITGSYFCGSNYVGGVVGSNDGTVENCSNAGTVSGCDNIGGVVGYSSGTVTGCSNTGSVISTSGDSRFAGGVVGSNDGTMENCTNKGTVSGDRYVGGVVGDNNGTVTNNHNIGEVSGTNYTGGVAGNNYNTVENCYNTGVVTSENGVGGVVAYNAGTVTDCYNSDTVIGRYHVGGVVGDNRDTVKNCYNTGTVSGEYLIGGTVGENIGTVANCYYLADSETDELDGTVFKTTDQFKSGEVAYLLGDAFGQTIGADTYPNFTGDTVYYGYTSCADDARMVYTNDSSASAEKPHNYENGTCTECGIHRVEGYGPDSDDSEFGDVSGTAITSSDTSVGTSWSDETGKGNLNFRWGAGDALNVTAVTSDETVAYEKATVQPHLSDAHRMQFLLSAVYGEGTPVIAARGFDEYIYTDFGTHGTGSVANIFTQTASGDPGFLSGDMLMYGEAEYTNGTASLEFQHIPATFRFVITNTHGEALTLDSVTLRVVDADGTPVAAAAKACDIEIYAELGYPELIYSYDTYDAVTTKITGGTLEPGQSYLAYALALPLGKADTGKPDENAFKDKTIQVTVTTSDGACIAFELAADKLAGANPGNNYNWVGGKSYTMRMGTRCADGCTFDATGNCTLCGYQCDHDGAEYKDNGDGTHDKVCGECRYVEVDNEAHTPAENATYTNNGNGTHSFTCTACGATVTEAHTMDITTGKCVCGADMTVVATVTDGTNTCYAADADTLNQAVTKILTDGSRTFTVELPADAEAGMITAIRRAICDTEEVDDGSIHLTLEGVTTIPDNNNNGTGFGDRWPEYDENNVEIVSHEEVTQLASINLPDVTHIGARAFYRCSNLTSITAPKVQSIGDWGLQGTAITSVDMPLLKEAGYCAFFGLALTEVSLPSLEKAGNAAFSGCEQLRTVDLPKLQALSTNLFYNCTSLVSVNVPAATSMGSTVFKGCANLQDIELPGVTELTFETFAGCTGLDYIALLSVITEVNANLFAGEDRSSGITLTLICGQERANTLPATAGANAEWAGFTWREVRIVHRYVDGKCAVCGKSCPGHTGGHATCTEKAVCTICGASYGYLGHTIDITTGVCTSCGEVASIATVTDDSTTLYASNADTLNQAVTAILQAGSRTFTVELPSDAEAGMITAIRRAICDTWGVADGSIHLTLKGVTTIPADDSFGIAFGSRNIYIEGVLYKEKVTQLASVNLPDVTEIGDQAFNECSNLTSVYCPKATTIESNAFSGCGFSTIVLPEATSIGDYAFADNPNLVSFSAPKATSFGSYPWGAASIETSKLETLELTAAGEFTIDTSRFFAYTPCEEINLVLNLDKKDQVTQNEDGTAAWTYMYNDDFGERTETKTFKSITFTCLDGTTNHSYIYTNNGNGTHNKICIKCVNAVTNEAHTLTYSVDGNILSETCACGHQATATVTAENAIYNGTAQETAGVSYSDGWMGGELTVSYENNTKAGTAAAQITLGEATAAASFTIAPKELTLSLTSYGKEYDGTNVLTSYEANVEGFIFYDEGSYKSDTLDYDDVYDDVRVDADALTVTLPGCKVGAYTTAKVSGITLIGEDAANYTLAETLENVPISDNWGDPFEIGKASITIISRDQNVEQGAEIDQNAYTVEGLPQNHEIRGVVLVKDGNQVTVNTETIVIVNAEGENVVEYFDISSRNEGILTEVCQGHTFNADGFCATGQCDTYQSATAAANEWGETVYEISNAGQLYWYAQQINDFGLSAGAVLTKDIVVPADAPNWIPIGGSNGYNAYTQSFDGQNHTISGLQCETTGNYAGLFGYTDYNYTIQNIGILNSSFKGTENVGALIGCAYTTVINCYALNTTVEGTGTVGGLVGYNGGSVTNSYTNSSSCVGYSSSGYGATVENCYYLSETETEDGGRTAAQFASGQVAYLLQSGVTGEDIYDDEGNFVETVTPEIWGQAIGTDTYPIFGGKKVYQIANTGCTVHGDYGYSNDENAVFAPAHEYDKGVCVCGTACPHEGEEFTCIDNGDGTHDKVYADCGYVIVDNEAHNGTPSYAVNTEDSSKHDVTYDCCGGIVTADHTADETIGQTCLGYRCIHCGEWHGEASNSAHVFADDNETCKYCQQIIVARVNWDGVVSYYTAIEDVAPNDDESNYAKLTLLANYTMKGNGNLGYTSLERVGDVTITVPNEYTLMVYYTAEWIDAEGYFVRVGKWDGRKDYGKFITHSGRSYLLRDLTIESFGRTSGHKVTVTKDATLTLTGASSISEQLVVYGELVLTENATLRNTGTTYLANDIYQSIDDIPAGLTGGSVQIKGITYTYVSGGSTDEKDHAPYWSCNSHVCGDSKVDCITRDHCDHCGDVFGELGGHTIDITTGNCVICNEYIAVATVTDGTTTLHADTGENLSTAIKQLMDGGSRTLTVDLPGYSMITDVCGAVSDASAGEVRTVHLTVKGLTTIGESTGFASMTQLATLSLPDVTYLYEYALRYTELERLELTAEEEITVEREVIDSNIVGLVDLVLCCNKADEVSDGVYWKGFTFKSVTFTEHDYVDGVCTICGTICDHKDSTHTTAANNGDGTHSFACSVCSTAVTEDHTFNETGKCVCTVQAVAKVNDYFNGIATYYYETLPEALAAAKALGSDGVGDSMGVDVYPLADDTGDFTIPAGLIYFYGEGYTFSGTVTNNGYIFAGTFSGEVKNNYCIYGGTFNGKVTNDGTIYNIVSGNMELGENFSIENKGTIVCQVHFWKDGVCRLCAEACDHTHGTPSYTWTEDPITLTVTVSCTACGETFTGSTEDMDVTTSEDGLTTTYTATVTLDGKDYTDSKVVSNKVTSVNITWGEMDFTYTDESGWNTPYTAWVQVENTGNTSVSVTYTYDTERTDITGSFFDGTATVTAPVAINTESTKKIWLRLDGTPSEALNNTTIGSVKLTIE